MTILFSLSAGRNTVCTIKRCLNVLKYNPNDILIVNCDVGIDKISLETSLSEYINTRFYINPISRTPNRFRHNILEAHCVNYKYIRDKNIVFDTIYLISDQDMFFKYGLSKLVKNYHAGFLICSNYIKPTNYKEIGFAGDFYINQKKDPFCIFGILENKQITRVVSEQIEGSFYCRMLFEKMLQYLESFPIHYTKIEAANCEEFVFGNLYINIFQDEFPIHLPISTIFRHDTIIDYPDELFNIITRQKERQSMISSNAYESFHMYTYGIKRVKYQENLDQKVDDIISKAKVYLREVGADNSLDINPE
jgi:hypothetical protein